MDIYMPGIKEPDLVRELPEKPLLIFTTAYKQFDFEPFGLLAADHFL
jgi:hypothetical protein